jgi:hypothetical protein
MAEANHSLSPNRVAERLRQHHHAVMTLALMRARQAVKDALLVVIGRRCTAT